MTTILVTDCQGSRPALLPSMPACLLPSSLSSLCPQQVCLPSPERVLTGQVLGKTPAPLRPQGLALLFEVHPCLQPKASLLPVSSPLAHAWIFQPPSLLPAPHTQPLPAAGTGVFLKAQTAPSPSKSHPRPFRLLRVPAARPSDGPCATSCLRGSGDALQPRTHTEAAGGWRPACAWHTPGVRFTHRG